MVYFNLDDFLLRLQKSVNGVYKVEKRTEEPVRLKVSSSPSEFVFLTFEENASGEVEVVLDFSSFSSDTFVADMTQIANSSV